MTNAVDDDRFWASFVGVTIASLEVLNARLSQEKQSIIEDLADLKSQAKAGIFDRKKSLNSKQTIVGLEVIRKFLSLSNVKNTSALNFSSAPNIARICEEAVNRTEVFIDGPVPKSKPKAAAFGENFKEEPIFSTACGETFDPARCSVKASDLYSQQKVEEYMDAYRLHKPSGANYARMCDILKSHWIRYMTDALIDVFSQSPLKLDVKSLRHMATERGLRVTGKSNQEIANDLIRFMVEKILTLDAIDYGMGDAADQIVNLLMSDSLNFSILTKKQKLGVIMMGSRFNRKLLQYVIVDESGSGLENELQAFQKSLSNLRASVSNLTSENGIKIAAGLAHSVAQAEKKASEVNKKAAGEEVEVPFPTKERVGHDNANFVSNLKFTGNNATFKIIGQIFELTSHLIKIAKLQKKVHIFLPSDAIMTKVLNGPMKGMSIEQFSAIPEVESLLNYWTITNAGTLVSSIKTQNGKFKTNSGDNVTLEISEDSQLITMTGADGENKLRINSGSKQHGDIVFYPTLGFTAGPYASKITAYANGKLESTSVKPGTSTTKSTVSTKPVPSSVKSNSSTVKPTSPTKSKTPTPVTIDLPAVSPAKKDVELSACEEFVHLLVKKSTSKISELLFGLNGVLKSTGRNIDELNDLRTLEKVVKLSKALKDTPTNSTLDFIHALAKAFKAQADVNINFDVQIDLTQPKKACKVFNDLIDGNIKATPPQVKPVSSKPASSQVKAKSSSQVKAKSSKPLVEENIAPETLFDALLALDCTIFAGILQAAEGSNYFDSLQDDSLEDTFVFAPTNKALEDFLEKIGQDVETMQNEDGEFIRDELLPSLFSYNSGDGSMFKTEDGTERAIPTNIKDSLSFGNDSSVFRIHKLKIPIGILDMMDVDEIEDEEEEKVVVEGIVFDDDSTPVEADDDFVPAEADDEEDWVEDLPKNGCQRLYQMYKSLTTTLPTTIAQFVAGLQFSPEDSNENIKAILILSLHDLYNADEEQLSKAITNEMIDYIRKVLIGYNQNTTVAGKMKFECAIVERLHVAGHSKLIADVNSKLAQTPLPKPSSPKSESKSKPSSPKSTPKPSSKSVSPGLSKKSTSPKSTPKPSSSPVKNDKTSPQVPKKTGSLSPKKSESSPTSPPKPTNPILVRLSIDPNLSQTYFLAGVTGFDQIIEKGQVVSFFAPSNAAWDRFFAKYGAREVILSTEKGIMNLTRLMHYHSSNASYNVENDDMVVTKLSVKGANKIVPLISQKYGTGQLESFPDMKNSVPGLYIIDDVQLSNVVDAMKVNEAKITDPISGKFGGGTSSETTGPQFEADVDALKADYEYKQALLANEKHKIDQQKLLEEKPKSNHLNDTLTKNGSRIMGHFASHVIVKDGKTLSQMTDETFTLFAPNDNAFAINIGMSLSDTYDSYLGVDPQDFLSLLNHHLVFKTALSEDELRNVAKERKTLVMSDGQDEDIDVGATKGTLYMRGDKKVSHIGNLGNAIIYDIDVVLTEVPDDDSYEVAQADDDSYEVAEADE